MARANEQPERDMVAIMVERQECRAYPRRKARVLVCLTGVVNRSIRYTWPSIEDNIVKPLMSKYGVDIAIFNNHVADCRVDGEILNNTDLAIVPHNFLFEYKQSDLDREVEKLPGFSTFSSRIDKDKKKRNGLRQMCIERKVAEFLEKNKDDYQYAVVTNADYFYVNELPLNTLFSIGNNHILSCHHHDCRGYTDGFYSGNCKAVRLVMNRINHYDELTTMPQHNGDWPNYETILKRSFLMNKIERVKADIFFVKVRANSTLLINPTAIRQKLRKFLEEHKEKNSVYKLLLDRIG